jgi:type I restriction enzyme M protein
MLHSPYYKSSKLHPAWETSDILSLFLVLTRSYQFVNLSIISGFFDTFLGYVYGIDRLVFPGIPRAISAGFVLTPGRFVGAEDVVDDGEPFEEKMGRLVAKLGEQFRESERLEGEIAGNLKGLGYRL